MTLLDRYIIKKLLDFLFLGLVVFTLLLFFSDALLDFMKDLQHYGIPWDIALTIVGLQIPKIVSTVIPMSALLAVLMVYNGLSNQFELIAMRMSGISLYRIATPALVIGITCAVFSFLLHDYVAPICNQYSRALKTYAIEQQNLPATQENFTYKQFDDDQKLKRLIYISHFNGNLLGYSTVIDLTNPKTLQVVQARGGEWGHNTLTLKDADVYTVASTQKLLNTTSVDRLALAHFIHPQIEVKTSAILELSFYKLLQRIQVREKMAEKYPAFVYVELWNKIMGPLSALPLVLIAVPLAITSPRKLNNLGFLTAILILFFYYVLRHISTQLGEHSVLPAILAASLPLIIISVVATILFQRKNRLL